MQIDAQEGLMSARAGMGEGRAMCLGEEQIPFGQQKGMMGVSLLPSSSFKILFTSRFHRGCFREF